MTLKSELRISALVAMLFGVILSPLVMILFVSIGSLQVAILFIVIALFAAMLSTLIRAMIPNVPYTFLNLGLLFMFTFILGPMVFMANCSGAACQSVGLLVFLLLFWALLAIPIGVQGAITDVLMTEVVPKPVIKRGIKVAVIIIVLFTVVTLVSPSHRQHTDFYFGTLVAVPILATVSGLLLHRELGTTI